MATAIEIITGALEELGYKAAETPLEAGDIKLCLNRLNAMLEEWELAGVGLGAESVLNPSDVLRLPLGSESSVMYNLASRIAAPMRLAISPELAQTIKSSSKNLLRFTSVIGEIGYPDNLPRGSGNNYDYGNHRDNFFHGKEKDNF